MPQIPIYENQVVSQPVSMPQVNKNLFVSGGQQVKESFNQLDQIATKFNEIDILRKKTKAANDLSIELNKIQNEAANDPDLDSFPKYQQKIDETIAKYSSQVPDGLAREQANEEFRISGYNSFASIRDNFRKRNIENQQLQTYEALESYRQSYIGSTSRDMKNAIIIQSNNLIDQNFQAGIWTAEQARSMKDAINRKWPIDEATYDATTNPELYEQRRSEYGLNPQDLSSADELARKTKERQKRIASVETTENQLANEIDYIVKMATNKIDDNFFDNLKTLVASGEASSEFAQSMNLVLTKPELIDINLTVEDSGFTSLVKNILETKNEEELKSGITKTLRDASGRMKINQEQLNVVLLLANEKYKELKRKENKISIFGLSLEQKAFFNSAAATAIGLFEYSKRIIAGDEPEEAKKKAIEKTGIETEPDRVDYQVDVIYDMPRGKLKCIGYDSRNKPVFEEVK